MDKLKNWTIGDNNIVTTIESYGECRKGHIAIDMPTHKSAAIIYRHEIEETDEECIAKAHLVAAAPDLLDALKVCYKSLCTYGSHLIIEKQVDNAIRKAEGRTA